MYHQYYPDAYIAESYWSGSQHVPPAASGEWSSAPSAPSLPTALPSAIAASTQLPSIAPYNGYYTYGDIHHDNYTDVPSPNPPPPHHPLTNVLQSNGTSNETYLHQNSSPLSPLSPVGYRQWNTNPSGFQPYVSSQHLENNVVLPPNSCSPGVPGTGGSNSSQLEDCNESVKSEDCESLNSSSNSKGNWAKQAREKKPYPGVIGKTRTKDKYRVVYTDHQRLELEKEFHYSKYITIRRKAELATTLGLSERQVKIWFQNRRAKDRKQAKKRKVDGSTGDFGDRHAMSPLTPSPEPQKLDDGHIRVANSPLHAMDFGASLSGAPITQRTELRMNLNPMEPTPLDQGTIQQINSDDYPLASSSSSSASQAHLSLHNSPMSSMISTNIPSPHSTLPPSNHPPPFKPILDHSSLSQTHSSLSHSLSHNHHQGHQSSVLLSGSTPPLSGSPSDLCLIQNGGGRPLSGYGALPGGHTANHLIHVKDERSECRDISQSSSLIVRS